HGSAWPAFHGRPSFRLRGRRPRRGLPEARNSARPAPYRKGPCRCDDGGRRPRQFRDEMVRTRWCRHRHLAHRLGRHRLMARIKHIALTTKEPAKVAEFYKTAFGLKELRRSPNGAVFLTDGHINVAILNYKTEKSADVGAHGPNFDGIHHF